MNYSWKRILSGSIAVANIAWALLAGAGLAVTPFVVLDAVALILIWNSDDLGGSTFIGLTTSPTPAWIVSLGGWIVLSLPVIILWHIYFH